MEKFVLGLAIGMAGGALIAANNCKVRLLIKKNQEEFMQKAEKYIDEKLEQAGCGCKREENEEGEDL